MRSVIVTLLLAVGILAGLTLWTRSQEPASRSGQAQSGGSERPRGPVAPDIVSSTWLNSAPLAPSDLRGRVVLVEFWTYG